MAAVANDNRNSRRLFMFRFLSAGTAATAVAGAAQRHDVLASTSRTLANQSLCVGSLPRWQPQAGTKNSLPYRPRWPAVTATKRVELMRGVGHHGQERSKSNLYIRVRTRKTMKITHEKRGTDEQDGETERTVSGSNSR